MDRQNIPPGKKPADSAVTGFAPVAGPESRLLILGTAPSVVSLREQGYYAHPRNAFWPIIAACFSDPPTAFPDYPSKLRFLLRNRLALWDVLGSCERRGSLDSAIRAECPNDIPTLLQKFPKIRQIGLNGQKAHKLFEKYIVPSESFQKSPLPCRRLPSTSPAYASLNFEGKLAQWRLFLQQVQSLP